MALAAVGVLGPGNTYVRNRLDLLASKITQQPRSWWSYPGDAALSRLQPEDIAILASEWKEAITRSNAQQPLGVVVETESLALELESPFSEVAELLKELASGLTRPLEATATKDFPICAVTFAVGGSSPDHGWNWPLRIMVSPEAAPELSRSVNGVRAAERGHAHMVSSLSASDLFIRELQSPAPSSELSGLELIIARYPLAANASWAEVASRRNPIVFLDPGHSYLSSRPSAAKAGAFINELVDQISHNLPLDSAIFEAHARTSSRGAMPLIFVPRFSLDEVLDGISLHRRVQDLLGVLRTLPQQYDLSGLPASVGYLGISSGATTVGALVSDLQAAVKSKSMNFMREKYGASALLDLNEHLRSRSVLQSLRGGTLGAGETEPAMSSEPALASIEAPAEMATRVDRTIQPSISREQARFTDLTLYEHHLFAEGELAAAKHLVDDEPLIAGRKYTLGVAIRQHRIGAKADSSPPRAVRNPRDEEEDLVIFVVARSITDGLNILNPLSRLSWPYDRDSTTALFRIQARPTPQQLRSPQRIEVSLFHNNLDLLDVVKLSLCLYADEDDVDGSQWSISWPSRKWPLRLTPDGALRGLNVQISSQNGGYRCNFLCRRGDDRDVELPGTRILLPGDLSQLIGKVRSFWTGRAIGPYSRQLQADPAIFRDDVQQLTELGREAWLLMFGAAAGEERDSGALGAILGRGLLDQTTHVQISYDPEVRDFVFPWSILCPPNCEPTANMFWGARYQIEQVADGPTEDALDNLPISIAATLDNGFKQAGQQLSLLQGLADKSKGRLVLERPVCTRADLFGALQAVPPSHLHYFFCHGWVPPGPQVLGPDAVKEIQATIDALPEDSPDARALQKFLSFLPKAGGEPFMFFGDAEVLDSALNQQTFFCKRRPIVFLNMCHSAALLPSMTSGLVRTFLDHEAAAVIGTEGMMTALFASEFATEVLDSLVCGQDVGTALLMARRKFLENRNPLGLAYTLYGRASAKLGAGDEHCSNHEHAGA